MTFVIACEAHSNTAPAFDTEDHAFDDIVLLADHPLAFIVGLLVVAWNLVLRPFFVQPEPRAKAQFDGIFGKRFIKTMAAECSTARAHTKVLTVAAFVGRD